MSVHAKGLENIVKKYLDAHGILVDEAKRDVDVLRSPKKEAERKEEKKVLKNRQKEFKEELKGFLREAFENQDEELQKLLDKSDMVQDQQSGVKMIAELESLMASNKEASIAYSAEIKTAIDEIRKIVDIRDGIIKRYNSTGKITPQMLEAIETAKKQLNDGKTGDKKLKNQMLKDLEFQKEEIIKTANLKKADTHKLMLCASHIDRYREYLYFLNGNRKELSADTRLFLQREKHADLLNAGSGAVRVEQADMPKEIDAEASRKTKDFHKRLTDHINMLEKNKPNSAKEWAEPKDLINELKDYVDGKKNMVSDKAKIFSDKNGLGLFSEDEVLKAEFNEEKTRMLQEMKSSVKKTDEQDEPKLNTRDVMVNVRIKRKYDELESPLTAEQTKAFKEKYPHEGAEDVRSFRVMLKPVRRDIFGKPLPAYEENAKYNTHALEAFISDGQVNKEKNKDPNQEARYFENKKEVLAQLGKDVIDLDLSPEEILHGTLGRNDRYTKSAFRIPEYLYVQ